MKPMAKLQRGPKKCDVVVIGSGAVGGTSVSVPTEKGIECALLEAGPMLDPVKEFKEHQWPYDVDYRGAEEGGKAYFGKGKPFGSNTLSGVRSWRTPTTVAFATIAASRRENSGRGARFLTWLRRLTVGGFYTSQMGIADLDYRGNKAVGQYVVPDEVLAYVRNQGSGK